ncbi:unnamed protein product [Blepharisma stoltei]|uniref:Uncharacterized protein n=1 Tax=Blepharisma stoltei TaxID=1481888 RepID=A0AAU9IWJ2_9CILI|nr:unnamed protein product [Blepharisma stoltei]
MDYQSPLNLSYQSFHSNSSIKKKINPTYDFSKWSMERPRGLARSEFSQNSFSNISFTSQGFFNDHKPSRKIIDAPQPLPSRPSSKRHRTQTPSRDPILQSEEIQYQQSNRKHGYNAKPSPDYDYFNKRKNCLPAELGISKSSYNRRNMSTVFENSFDAYYTKPAKINHQQSQCADLIHYRYGPSFKDEEITTKI